MYPLKIKEKYDPKNLQKLAHRFTVPYMGTYTRDYKEYSGSHPWVDIAPAFSRQEVYCVLDGKVYKAGSDPAYGNYVFIEHKNVPHPENFSLTTTLISCYFHLSDVFVKTGDVLKEGHVIGTTGNTGLSFWEHLHFQIDRKEAPFHAYWPYSSQETRKLGITFSQWVNIGLWKEKAMLYTVNPLVYLDAIEEERNKWWGVLQTQAQTKPNNTENVQNPPTAEQQKEPFPFKDIQENDELAPYLLELTKKGALHLRNDGLFFPNNFISRVEALKILFVSQNVPISQSNKTFFVDVPASSWYAKYVNTAYEWKIISSSNKKFFPQEYITRVEALKLCIQFFKKPVNGYEQNFIDVKNTDWYAKYVDVACKYQLIPCTPPYFYPNKYITRYEYVRMLFLLSQ